MEASRFYEGWFISIANKLCVGGATKSKVLTAKKKTFFLAFKDFPVKLDIIRRQKGREIMGLIWSLIVGAIIGAIAGALTNKGKTMGCFANIFAGLVGSWAGQALFGAWGPSLAGMALVPSILGAVIVVAVVSFFLGEN